MIDTRQRLLALATEQHFDLVTPDADKTIGRELIGLHPVPVVMTGLEVNYNYGGGGLVTEANNWVAAAQAAAANVTHETFLEELASTTRSRRCWWRRRSAKSCLFGNLNQNGAGDYDGDGNSNLKEFLDGTDLADALNAAANQLSADPPEIELSVQNGQLILMWEWPDAYANKMNFSVFASRGGWPAVPSNSRDDFSPHERALSGHPAEPRRAESVLPGELVFEVSCDKCQLR